MKRPGFVFAFLTAVLALCVSACGGGGGGASPVSIPAAVATPTPAPTASPQTVSIVAGNLPATATFGANAAGASGSATIQGALSGTGSINVAFSSSAPPGLPTVQSIRRAPKAIGNVLTAYAYFTLTPFATLQFVATPVFTLTIPNGLPANATYYVGTYDAVNAWTTLLGPAVSNGSSISFISKPVATAFTAGQAITYVIYSTAEIPATPSPSPSPTPTPTPAPVITTLVLATPGPGLAAMSSIGLNTFGSAIATTSTTGVLIGVSNQLITTTTSSAPNLAADGLLIKVGSNVRDFPSSVATQSRLPQAVVPSGFSEQHRAELIDPEREAAVARLFQGATRSAQPLQSRRRAQALPVTVGSSNSFAVVNGAIGASSTSMIVLPATLGAVSAHGYIWIDNTLSLTSQSIATIGADFDNAYASDTTHFGAPEYTATSPGALLTTHPCDTSGVPIPGATPVPLLIPPPNGMHVVLVVNPASLGTGVGGYFSTTNMLVQSAANCITGQPKSNEASMIVVEFDPANPLSFELQEDLVRGTAHELQHDINFISHYALAPAPVVEDRWINEGLSMLAQDFAVTAMFPAVPNDVDDAIVRGSTFMSAPYNFSLTGFTGIDPGKTTFAFNCAYCYGAEYLFQRYLYDRFGGDAYTHAMESSTRVSFANLQAVTGVQVSQLVSDFATALQNSGTGVSTDARYNFTHFNPSGTYVDQFNRTVRLTGPAAQQAFPGTNPTGAYVGTFTYTLIRPTAGAGAGISISDPSGGFGLAPTLWQK